VQLALDLLNGRAPVATAENHLATRACVDAAGGAAAAIRYSDAGVHREGARGECGNGQHDYDGLLPQRNGFPFPSAYEVS
jgi:hypothetical protein